MLVRTGVSRDSFLALKKVGWLFIDGGFGYTGHVWLVDVAARRLFRIQIQDALSPTLFEVLSEAFELFMSTWRLPNLLSTAFRVNSALRTDF